MKLPIDEKAWSENPKIDGFVATPKGETPPIMYRFTLPHRTETINAMVVDGGKSIELFRERSSSHRALLEAFGA